jgi:hypothetical protein
MDNEFNTKKASSEDNRESNISSFTKDGINMVFLKVSQRLEKSESKKKEIFGIFEKGRKRVFTAEFSGRNRLKVKNLFRKGACNFLLEGMRGSKSIHLFDLRSIIGRFEKRFQKGTNRHHMPARTSSCHRNNFLVLCGHLIR